MKTEPIFATADSEFEQLRKLTEISRALTYISSADQVRRLIVERAADLLGGNAAVVMQGDEAGMLQVTATHGVPEDRLMRFSSGLDEDVAERLRGLLEVSDECFLAVPLVVGGTVTGLLAVTTVHPASSDDEGYLSALGDQAAIALESARLEEQVRRQAIDRQENDGAMSAKDQALATLAHDIRTPLGSIEAYSALIEDEVYGPINDRQREALGRIRLSGRHLLSLLENVMEMARLNAGVLHVGSEPVCLSTVAREAVHMLLPQADAKLQTLEMIDPADVTVTADHGRVRQILINLIGNAVKFTPENGTVRVRVDASGAGREMAEIQVADSGPGISPEERRAIFEPYYRSEQTAKLPGVGLGLAISHALAREMNGDLSVASGSDGGACFILRLPVRRD